MLDRVFGLQVMDVLHLEEISAKHIVKRWMKDARDILPGHLIQYQKHQSPNKSFTCSHSTHYVQAIGDVRMGDASAEAFEHMSAGLKALPVSCAPLGEKRDGLGFEDHQVAMPAGRLPSNGEIAVLANGDAHREESVGLSVSVIALQGLALPEKQRGVGRLTSSKEKAPYEGLSKLTKFCSICRREGHKRRICPDQGDAPKQPRKPGKWQELWNGRPP